MKMFPAFSSFMLVALKGIMLILELNALQEGIPIVTVISGYCDGH